MTAIVTRGDAGNLHLPDETVDLVVTSPPYFGLRSYQDGGEHYAEQIGAEATPGEYLDALMACTAEWMRVLKPGGSIFVNLGDKYATAGTRQGNKGNADGITVVATAKHYGKRPEGFRDKSLMMLPQRYAIRCIDELGLILRAEIVWAKPNGLPESVTDRVRRSHEQVFHFVKEPRYYSAVDEVREAHKPGQSSAALSFNRLGRETAPGQSCAPHRVGREDQGANPLGKLPGSVWTIPTAPLKVPASLGIDHFAAYPPELVRRIVLGWSPREVCTACGEGLRPVATVERIPTRRDPNGMRERVAVAGGERVWESSSRTDTGYACACPHPTVPQTIEEQDEVTGERVTRVVQVSDPAWINLAPTTPGVVLDPFGGTGTTALVASAHGRVGISVDLSADYCRLAQWRTTDPGERARVLKVEKPPVQVDGQLGMFEGISA